MEVIPTLPVGRDGANYGKRRWPGARRRPAVLCLDSPSRANARTLATGEVLFSNPVPFTSPVKKGT